MSTTDIARNGDAVAPQRAAAAEAVPEQPRYSREVTLFTMLSVLLVMLLASLDQTIVGTALPRIIADLKGFDRYTWVTTAYLLTSTVMIPIYGKLSDIFGRKPIMIIALTIFLVGSALSGISQDMTQLIIFRGFQGLGAGGLMSLAIAIIGDLFSPRERARWQGVTGAVFGLAFILGPTAGGWITDNFSWRWVFYVNLPLGVIALAVLGFLMPTLYKPSKGTKIDYIGAGLLIVGVVPLLLGFSWAGSQYAWNSPQVIGLFIGAAVGLVAFVTYEMYLERTNRQPTIEPSLFRNPIFTVTVLVTMLSSVALIGSIYYIPLFLQAVVGVSATNSGSTLTPLMLTAIVMSIFSGLLVARLGKYKMIALVGSFIAILGAATLLRLGVHSTNLDVILSMLVLGLGIGTSLSLYTLVVQNALPTKIGQASAGLTFFRQIGSTTGLAALGAVFNSTYPTAFAKALPASVQATVPAQVLAIFHASPQILLSPTQLAQVHASFQAFGPGGEQLFQGILGAVKVGVADSLHGVFLFGLGISVLSTIILFFLKEIPLRGGPRQTAAMAPEAALSAEIPSKDAAEESTEVLMPMD
ncbi:MAG: MFS transporter [Ktedonobacterales bacterium]|nr:MFS transporter [Ktedonobacterales bacterium]